LKKELIRKSFHIIFGTIFLLLIALYGTLISFEIIAVCLVAGTLISIAIKKEKSTNVAIVKKMRDYSKDSAFKKKAENTIAFLKKNGLPKAFKKK
jgi:hypothetical protein